MRLQLAGAGCWIAGAAEQSWRCCCVEEELGLASTGTAIKPAHQDGLQAQGLWRIWVDHFVTAHKCMLVRRFGL